jgi:methyl-accepting chemotaxis protein
MARQMHSRTKGEELDMRDRPHKRKLRVIDSPFQYRMIATFLGVVLAGFVLFSAGLFLYYWISYAYGDNLFKEIITLHKQVTETKVVEENGVQKTVSYTTTRDVPGVNRLELILPPLLVNNLAIMLFMIVVGIFISHRIAGPVFRVEKEINRVLAGEKGVRVKLRKNDSFPELAEKVNGLIELCEGSHGNED